MEHDSSLTVSLEEFGLSQYEARAYFTLISKGSIAAAELAYHAELPRTKVYSILQKLQKKSLITVTNTKPIVCTAVSPEEAFDSTIQEQINKVNAMNSLISTLKAISEESRRNRGVKEKHYYHMVLGNAVRELKAAIEGCRRTLRMAVGPAGREPVLECRREILAAMRRGVDVYLLVSADELGAERGVLPACTGVRVTEQTRSMFIADGSGVVALDESGGGDVLSATDALGPCMSALFDAQWNEGIDAGPLLDMTRAESAEVYAALRQIRRRGLAFAMEASLDSRAPDMAGMLEEGGVPVHARTVGDLVEMADAALRSACGGGAALDPGGGTISLESAPHHAVWASVLDSYLARRGYSTKIIPNRKGIRIQLEKR